MMNVKELIQYLSRCDPMAVVWIGDPEGGPYTLDKNMIRQEVWDGDKEETCVILGMN